MSFAALIPRSADSGGKQYWNEAASHDFPKCVCCLGQSSTQGASLVLYFHSFLAVGSDSFLNCSVSWQDLLQLQYEGVAVMKLFDRAKVNVNLLIFLLNKKFYGK